jgi:hypothetical protein
MRMFLLMQQQPRLSQELHTTHVHFMELDMEHVHCLSKALACFSVSGIWLRPTGTAAGISAPAPHCHVSIHALYLAYNYMCSCLINT